MGKRKGQKSGRKKKESIKFCFQPRFALLMVIDNNSFLNGLGLQEHLCDTHNEQGMYTATSYTYGICSVPNTRSHTHTCRHNHRFHVKIENTKTIIKPQFK